MNPQHNPVCDVAIVGAGPAGLAAAQLLSEHGVAVTIIDEQLRAGGQILRQPPVGFVVDRWLPGRIYDRTKAVLRAVSAREEIDWCTESTALGILQTSAFESPASSQGMHRLWIQGPAGSRLLSARAVLVAAGCYERPLAFPGWTLPGVMGAGAIQAFLKSQQFIPGDRFVLAGSHPLQLVVADQLVAAGANVAAVVFTQNVATAAALLRHPLVVLQQHRQLFEAARILWRLRRLDVPVLFGHTIVRADGDHAVQRSTLAQLRANGSIDRGRTRIVECDRVGVCHGFLCSSELARQAGARARRGEHEGGWVIEHDEWFESSVANIFVAGEVTGVAGAEAALEKGRVAAAGILRKLERLDAAAARRLAGPARRRLSRVERFAGMLRDMSRPPPDLGYETMTDESIVCRCESVSCADLERALRANTHIASADAAKLFTRAGMGFCQGRLCGDNVARLVARARDLPVAEIGPFHARMPVKPVVLDTLCPESSD